jgi:hypothetical protein
MWRFMIMAGVLFGACEDTTYKTASAEAVPGACGDSAYGMRVYIGEDTNSDGALTPDEADEGCEILLCDDTRETVPCDVVGDWAVTAVALEFEDCPHVGGAMVLWGYDTNSDGVLDDDEVRCFSTICGDALPVVVCPNEDLIVR